MTSDDTMLESTMNKVLAVFEGHADDDEDFHWTAVIIVPDMPDFMPNP